MYTPEKFQIVDTGTELTIARLDNDTGQLNYYALENGVQRRQSITAPAVTAELFSYSDLDPDDKLELVNYDEFGDPADRKEGWYLCVIDYDLHQFLLKWDPSVNAFYGNGDQAMLLEQTEFCYISKEPFDLTVLSTQFAAEKVTDTRSLQNAM